MIVAISLIWQRKAPINTVRNYLLENIDVELLLSFLQTTFTVKAKARN